MALIAGIDEAGLGPLLGPLVVSATVFRVPDRSVDECLWQNLRDTCTQSPSSRDRRLAIADSKKLYKSRASLAPLERAALVMLAAYGARPTNLRELLDGIAPDASRQLEDHPWYSGGDLALPLDPEVGDVGTRANAVRRNCVDAGVKPVAVLCEPLFEAHYNRLVGAMRNKASVLITLAMRLIDRIVRASNERRIRICIDRLGGRTHYRDALATAMPDYEIQVLEEATDISRYRLACPARVIRIEFATGGEQRHLPVALASVYSKYVRELCMHLFNRYWSQHVADLKPTAGYYTDAKRWLGDAAPAIKKFAVRRDALVRSR